MISSMGMLDSDYLVKAKQTELLSAEADRFLAVSFGLKSFRSHARFLLSLDKFEPTKKRT
ncbi:MAG: hypothetical protein CMN21_06730 [Rubinisphaera sp.]|nr:hypothetical protein [Rubinisphaera sp.]